MFRRSTFRDKDVLNGISDKEIFAKRLSEIKSVKQKCTNTETR